jgi:hypothetical protein
MNPLSFTLPGTIYVSASPTITKQKKPVIPNEAEEPLFHLSLRPP